MWYICKYTMQWGEIKIKFPKILTSLSYANVNRIIPKGYLATTVSESIGELTPKRFSAITRKVYSLPPKSPVTRQVVLAMDEVTRDQLPVIMSRFSTT